MDQIARQIVLKALPERVWRAISDSARFGAWFGVAFDGPFVAGTHVVGRIVPTRVDPDVAALQEPHRGKVWQAWVEQIEPMRLFSYRWHPFAVDPARDYSAEPTTRVRFELAEADDGTLLTITETGFDAIPSDRRAAAIAANSGGWDHQLRLIEKYLSLEPG